MTEAKLLMTNSKKALAKELNQGWNLFHRIAVAFGFILSPGLVILAYTEGITKKMQGMPDEEILFFVKGIIDKTADRNHNNNNQ